MGWKMTSLLKAACTAHYDVRQRSGRVPNRRTAMIGTVGIALLRAVRLADRRLAPRILIVLLLALAGLASLAEAQWPLGKELTGQETKGESFPNVTGTGRFQIFVSPQAKGYTFMLDTETGRVWIMKKDHTSGEFSLHRVQVEQIDSSFTPKPQPDKTEKTEKNEKTKSQERNK
jgi:hypothetical protein